MPVEAISLIKAVQVFVNPGRASSPLVIILSKPEPFGKVPGNSRYCQG